MQSQTITNDSSLAKPYLGSLRLPSYRFTHLGRYHPYGRKTAYHGSRGASDFDPMRTQDRRFDEHGRPSFALSVITEEEELPTRNEEEAQAPIDTDRLVVIGAHPEKAAGFIEAVIDFAFAMRRRLRNLAGKRA